tara:strand:- start:10002 stop:10493 length:492 start_codon:yes stop_codon:yes gene_type:complete
MPAINYRIKLQRLEGMVVLKHKTTRRLAPREIQILRRYARDIVSYIQERWPVDTGTSRAAWTYGVETVEGSYAINLENRMWYSSYVHYRGSPKAPGRHGNWLVPAVYEDVVPEAWDKYGDRLYADLAREIIRTEKELFKKPKMGLIQVAQTFEDIFHPWQAVL